MVHQILIGILVTLLTIFVQAAFIAVTLRIFSSFKERIFANPSVLKVTTTMTLVASWLIIGMGIGTVMWALALLKIGAFPSLEPALYFSMVAFTTLGFGDVLLDPEWRLIAGIIAADGLVIFGLNTAVLVDFAKELRIRH